MDTNRKIAIAVGILFIVATCAAVIQFPLITSTNAPDYLIQIAADGNKIMTSVLLDVLMIAAVVAIPVVLFPVLRKQGEGIARMYLAARLFEAIPLAISTISLLMLLVLSREYVAAGSPVGSHFQTLGTMLQAQWDLALVIGGQIVFCMTALVLNVALYRSRLVPRLLSIWGLVGVPLMLAGSLLVLYGVVENSSTIQTALMVPLAVQEMAFALWLIVKGFNPSAVTST